MEDKDMTAKGSRKKAMEAEAQELETLKLTFRGVDLVVPAGDDMDIDTMQLWEEGKVVLFVKAAVGEAQWRKLHRAGVNKIRDLRELAKALFGAQGTSEGE